MEYNIRIRTYQINPDELRDLKVNRSLAFKLFRDLQLRINGIFPWKNIQDFNGRISKDFDQMIQGKSQYHLSHFKIGPYRGPIYLRDESEREEFRTVKQIIGDVSICPDEVVMGFSEPAYLDTDWAIAKYTLRGSFINWIYADTNIFHRDWESEILRCRK